MRSQREYGSDIILVIIIVLILVSCAWLAYEAYKFAKEMAVAVSGLGTGVILAYVKYVFDLRKDRQQRESLAKQRNYKELLSKIGDFVRDSEGADDAIVSAHLGSIAFGDKTVIAATNKFMGKISEDTATDNLLYLLKTIRSKSGLEVLDENFWKGYDVEILFPEKVQVGLKRKKKPDAHP